MPLSKKIHGDSNIGASKMVSSNCRDEPYDDEMTPEYEAFLKEKLSYLENVEWTRVGEKAW